MARDLTYRPYSAAGRSVVVPSSIEGASTVSSLNTKTKIATIASPSATPMTIPISRSPRRCKGSDPLDAVEEPPVGPEGRLGRGDELVGIGVGRDLRQQLPDLRS